MANNSKLKLLSVTILCLLNYLSAYTTYSHYWYEEYIPQCAYKIGCHKIGIKQDPADNPSYRPSTFQYLEQRTFDNTGPSVAINVIDNNDDINNNRFRYFLPTTNSIGHGNSKYFVAYDFSIGACTTGSVTGTFKIVYFKCNEELADFLASSEFDEANKVYISYDNSTPTVDFNGSTAVLSGNSSNLESFMKGILDMSVLCP
mmetsp:Transcript_35530/g.36924  ORF Transcript_35530/g.36924 Transcript_35530/m.36924 type:complete len:202 (-) Transcript_35530:117-722(-)